MGNLPTKPAIPEGGYITVSVAAIKYLGLSQNHVRHMCLMGVFPGAIKPGTGHWRIPRCDVIAHLNREVMDK